MITNCKNCHVEITWFNRVEVHRKAKTGRGPSVTVRGLCRPCYMEQQRGWQRRHYNAKHPQGPRSHKRKPEAPPEKELVIGEPVKTIHPHFAMWLMEMKQLARENSVLF